MHDTPRARPGSDGVWDRARRAYRALLGDDDPAAGALAAGAIDLRLGGGPADPVAEARQSLIVASGPDDLLELRTVVEAVTGRGSWPVPPALTPDGAVRMRGLRSHLDVGSPAPVLALLLALEGVVDQRSPWGKWRTTVDTLAPRIRDLTSLTVDVVVLEPRAVR